MRKYIRTKVGIYQVRKPALDEYLWEDSTYVYGHGHIDNKDIIKRADTIKELCDEIIVVSNDKKIKPYCLCMDNYNLNLFVKFNYSFCTIYGAIWTDKGLIYVAKMNDKGELELL